MSALGAEADGGVDLGAGEVRVRPADAGAGAPEPVTLPLGPGVAHGVNLAVAVGVAVAVGLEPAALAGRLAALPRAAHRAEVSRTAGGLVVVDDTYNANPVGAHAALAEAAGLAAGRSGRLVLVTPGMVELGHVQAERNEALGRAAAEAGAHVVVVGRTNREALVAGIVAAGGSHDVVDRRDQAVPLATTVAGPEGVILYENDLPDHYP